MAGGKLRRRIGDTGMTGLLVTTGVPSVESLAAVAGVRLSPRTRTIWIDDQRAHYTRVATEPEGSEKFYAAGGWWEKIVPPEPEPEPEPEPLTSLVLPGIAAPEPVVGSAILFCDVADGGLKVVLGSGAVVSLAAEPAPEPDPEE
jgi:hypothetical protein